MIAIHHKAKAIFLNAGAGSGKTSVIVGRIKRLIQEGVDPKKILAITFTRKAAQNLRERIDNTSVTALTFDSLCVKTIQENHSYQIINEIEAPFSKEELQRFSVYQLKASEKKPSQYNQYIAYKKRMKVIDFYDANRMFLNYLESSIMAFTHVFVDEFQDTNHLQYDILKAFNKHEISIFVVGDYDQSIYRFRGAKEQVINVFIKDFSATILILNKNYRSTKMIIHAANRLIAHNQYRYEKCLIAHNTNQGLCHVMIHEDREDEIKRIQTMLAHICENKKFKIAILYRHHQRGYECRNAWINEEHITFLTFHEAKGLEFDIVVILDIDERTLLHYSHYQYYQWEEERRLMYVAVTRAKQHLIVSSIQVKSKFVKEMKLKHL